MSLEQSGTQFVLTDDILSVFAILNDQVLGQADLVAGKWKVHSFVTGKEYVLDNFDTFLSRIGKAKPIVAARRK